MTNTIANATLASVSETNRSRIMQHLYQHGISSRAQIAKALDLTPAAITKITAKLIEAGAIKETGDFEGRKNRRSIGLTSRHRRIPRHRREIRAKPGYSSACSTSPANR